MPKGGFHLSHSLKGGEGLKRVFLLLGLALLGAFLLSGAALAATLPGDNGPDDLSATVVADDDNTPGKSDVILRFTHEGGDVTYYVYYVHINDDSGLQDWTFKYANISCTVNSSGDVTGSSGANCTKDPLYGYITISPNSNDGIIGDVNNYEEYNYLVGSSADSVGDDPNEDLVSYVIVRAFPPTQTRHGNYTEYTNACTACHGLHSSNSIRLLKGPSVTDLCITCHDGTGSKYDEVRGYVRLNDSGTTAFAAAGPFGEHVKSGGGVGETSIHNVTRATSSDILGTDPDTMARIWMAPGSTWLRDGLPKDSNDNGNRVYRFTTYDWSSWLYCSSCHEPHDRGKNFRELRPVINDRTNIAVRGATMVNTAGDMSGIDRGVWGGGRVTSPVFARAMYTRFLAGGNSVLGVYLRKAEDPAYMCNVTINYDPESGEETITCTSLKPDGNKDGDNDGDGNLVIDWCDAENGLKGTDASYSVGLAVYDDTSPTGMRCRVMREMGGVVSFCTACHRTFMWFEYSRKERNDYPYGSGTLSGYDTAVATYGSFVPSNNLAGTLGQHKHPMSLPAAHAYEEGRLVDGVLGPKGDVCKAEGATLTDHFVTPNHRCDNVGQGRLVGPFPPLEGTSEGPWREEDGEEAGYAEGIVMCLTCHVAHGSGSEKLQVAYKNYGLNNTSDSDLTRNSDTNYLEVLPRPSAPPNWWENENNLVSSALARFNPMASVCFRCHSTTPDSAYIDY